MPDATARRTSIVLFNLGGPDGPKAVRPFLFNLFNDRAIISLPQPFRWLVAQLISRSREKTALAIYARIGGRSPLAEETEAQRAALEAELSVRLGERAQVVVAMRYWKPTTATAVAAVSAFDPARIVLLPLYPQYSTTTTASSFLKWKEVYSGRAAVSAICCYPEHQAFVRSHVEAIRSMVSTQELTAARLIFSAHGLPEKVVAGGDPYQDQVERTARRVADALGAPDWVVAYQSRVGPLKWIGPSTLDVLHAAGAERRAVIVVPIAFVSEHSETLVELDIEYREYAETHGISSYTRVPAIGVLPDYINGLADMVMTSLEGGVEGVSACSSPCGEQFSQCPLRTRLIS